MVKRGFKTSRLPLTRETEGVAWPARPEGITGHYLSRSEHSGSALSSFIILPNCNDILCIDV